MTINMKTSFFALLGTCGLVFLCSEAWAWQANISGTAGRGAFNATALDGTGNVVAAGSTTNTDTGNDFTVAKFDAAGGAELWRQAINGTANGDDRANAVTIDGAGNVVAAGYTISADTGYNFTVIKFDGATGAELWRQAIPGGMANAVAVDEAGNVEAVGTLVVKLDGASGAELWRQGIPNGSARAVAIDGAGNVVAAGAMRVYPYPGCSYDAIVMTFDGTSGAELWRRFYGNSCASGSSSVFEAVTVDGAGNVVVTGFESIGPPVFTVIKLDGTSGAQLWRRTVTNSQHPLGTGHAVAIDGDGNVVAAGFTYDAATGQDLTVVKLDGISGADLWRRVINGPGNGSDVANAVAVDGAGNVVAAGVTVNNHVNPDGAVETISDFTVVKFDGAGGAAQWQQVFPSASGTSGQAHAVKIDAAGDVIAAGTVSGSATVVKFNGTDGSDFTPPDTTPPTVTITSPANGATVSGAITVSADASDNVGVTGVQFLVDGTPLGAEDTTAPYEAAWDTRTVADGTHTLTAQARDAADNRATSVPVRVTVANGPLPTLTLSRAEETAATLAGGWVETASAAIGVTLSGDRAVYSSAAGATATFTFTGTGVRWIGVPCEVCGLAHVLIDGVRVATVDTYAPTRPAVSEAVFTSPRLAAGSHTVVIEVTGTANASSGSAYVLVDAFDVTVDGAGLLPPIPATPTSILGGAGLTP